MIYYLNYEYTDEKMRLFLCNDFVPINISEFIDYSNWGENKLKYVDSIVESKINSLIELCKLEVDDLIITLEDKIITKSSAVDVIKEKVKSNNKAQEMLLKKLNRTIKTWYIKKYPTDDFGKKLSDTVTFLDLNNLLNSKQGDKVYELLGKYSDSIIRERCFEELSNILDEPYNAIYQRWLIDRNESIEKEINYLKNKMDVCAYGNDEIRELSSLENELEEIER